MRVVAGRLRGRRLTAPPGERLRPTSDRAREALFNSLVAGALGGPDLVGCHFLDGFCGTGAAAIEALSRGAARADFVDSDRAARAALEANLDALAIGERARIWPLTLPAGLGRMRAVLGAADLVLADPPYGGRIAVATLEALGAAGVLREGARVVLEHHAKDALPDAAGALRRVRDRTYGQTVVSTYRVEPRTPGP